LEQRQLQLSAAPPMCPIGDKLTIAGANIPAIYGSGDAFDFVHDPDGDRVGFLLCDVKSHGVGPAFVASRLCGAFRTAFRLGCSLEQIDSHLEQCVRDLWSENNLIAAEGTVGILDIQAQRVDYLRAGGRRPTRRTGSQCDFVGDVAAPAFAWDHLLREPTPQPCTESSPLEPGSSLVFFTDGLTDAQGRAPAIYGSNRALQAHAQFDGADAQALSDHALHSAIEYAGRDPANIEPGLVFSLDDDATALAFHWAQ
jgi:phosphoserine phosphatase RsbU/P